MRLDHLPGDVHLTYCTNIHAGESWDEVRDSLEAHLPPIKAAGLARRAARARPAALGDRRAGAEPARGVRRAARAFCRGTISTSSPSMPFPTGPFHGTRVKEDVYQPDWLTPERLTYTDQARRDSRRAAARRMAGSVSTVPGTFKAVAARRPDAPRVMADMMARHAANLVDAAAPHRARDRARARARALLLPRDDRGDARVLSRSSAHRCERGDRRAGDRPFASTQAREALRRHLGVCYDICHGAVEFEDPGRRFRAVRGGRHPHRQAAAQLGAAAADSRRRDRAHARGVRRRRLPAPGRGAPERLDHAPRRSRAGLRGAARRATAGGEWRVHCHVPVFLEVAGQFHSTQPTLKAALACTKAGFVAPHLEVETYTWDVLPPELRQEQPRRRDRARDALGAARSLRVMAVRSKRFRPRPCCGSAGCRTCRRSGPTCSPRPCSPAAPGRTRAPASCWSRCRCSMSAACISTTTSTARSTRANVPGRPIPAGDISANAVAAAGFGMLCAGVVLLAATGVVGGRDAGWFSRR